MGTFKKISYFIGLPVIVVVLLLAILYNRYCDFEKAVGITASLVQTMAIFVGGLWAYHKFGWDKKAESVIKVKALLMEYRQSHSFMAAQYRVDLGTGVNESEAYLKYATAMIGPRNQVVSQIHLSCYLPKKLREKIFAVIWLTIGNNHGKNREYLNINWEKFGKDVEEIEIELDDVVSK